MRTAGPRSRGAVSGTRATLGILGCGLVALGALGLIGAGTELATDAGRGAFLAPWIGLGMLVVAIAMFAVPGSCSMAVVRLLCLVVLGTVVFSVVEHLAGSAPGILDEDLADHWGSLSSVTRSWYGADDLGPSTRLAPGLLGQSALLVLIATLDRRGRRRAADHDSRRRSPAPSTTV